jgi:NTE family protein
MDAVVGLVLTGGGARAAYQVGALRAIADVARDVCPFDVVSGVSAGAINSAAIAASADDFAVGIARLESTWRGLTPERVYRTDAPNLAFIAAGWLRQLGGGGCAGPADVNALLDTGPLRELLTGSLRMERIREHVASGRLRGAAVTATSYHTGTAITFFDGAPEHPAWARTSRVGRRATLTVDHVLASAAIPLFFPPIPIDGNPYGDGCVRLTAPLSPAIHLGAERILAIGIRSADVLAETPAVPGDSVDGPTPAEIAGVLLNAVFLDSLETDAERVERINATLSIMSAEQRARLVQPLRQIPLLVLRPSVDLGQLAAERYRELPWPVRYLLRGIGADGRRGWDLVSYLAFEPVYIERLIELGHRDTIARAAELEAFLASRRRAA